jgi:hypothetical protein
MQRHKGKNNAKIAEKELKENLRPLRKTSASLCEKIQSHAKTQRKKHAKIAEREFKISATSAKKLCVSA